MLYTVYVKQLKQQQEARAIPDTQNYCAHGFHFLNMFSIQELVEQEIDLKQNLSIFGVKKQLENVIPAKELSFPSFVVEGLCDTRSVSTPNVPRMFHNRHKKWVCYSSEMGLPRSKGSDILLSSIIVNHPSFRVFWLLKPQYHQRS